MGKQIRRKATDIAHKDEVKEEAPFGGIQLVLAGDFLQLSPVIKKIGEKRDQPKLNLGSFCSVTL